MKITTADLDWVQVDDIEIPVSKQFGDVYFSKDNGLLETRYVFLQGNDLAERLANLQDKQYFSVGETGFGTGLNFLALWQLWRQVRPNNQSRLHMVSVEKYPLSHADLQRALKVWTELADCAELLMEQYPLPIAGCHRLYFPKERLSLDLWFGDAVDVLPQIKTEKSIDAWFLDGFAPACNPDFWQENILKHIVRLSGQGTTFASFTVAGVVKRGLAQYGIQVTRPKGFGRKREMLKAIWLETENSPYEQRITANKIAVLGAGIAGLSCAYALAQRGYSVDIYDKNQAVTGASGNPLALLNPKLCPIEQTTTHLMVCSWLYAMRYYAQFSAFRPLTIQQVQLKNADENLALQQDYPTGVLSCEKLDTTLELKFPQLNLHYAGAVQPKILADEILTHSNIQFIQQEIDELIEQDNGQSIQLQYQKQKIAVYDKVIVCTAKDSQYLIQNLAKLKAIRGQVSYCQYQAMPTHSAYSYGGYMAQADEHTLLLGASFYPNRDDDEVLLVDHQHNLDLAKQTFGTFAEQLPDISTWQGRASIRAQTADYFPLVGRVGESEIYTLSGLGSKGFLFAPLCAEMLMAQMLGEHYPIPEALFHKLKPQRFRKKVLS